MGNKIVHSLRPGRYVGLLIWMLPPFASGCGHIGPSSLRACHDSRLAQVFDVAEVTRIIGWNDETSMEMTVVYAMPEMSDFRDEVLRHSSLVEGGVLITRVDVKTDVTALTHMEAEDVYAVRLICLWFGKGRLGVITNCCGWSPGIRDMSELGFARGLVVGVSVPSRSRLAERDVVGSAARFRELMSRVSKTVGMRKSGIRVRGGAGTGLDGRSYTFGVRFAAEECQALADCDIDEAIEVAGELWEFLVRPESRMDVP